MAAPGMNVSTAARSGPTGVVLNPSSQYFVAGITERGPVDAPVRLNSLADYKKYFGDRVTYGALYDDLQMYFECGGTQAWALRVVGPAATIGTLSLVDGSAVATLRCDAANPGAWSSRLTVQIEVGAAGAGSRKATVRLDGNVVEVYNNLLSPADFVSRFAASQYVRFTDLASATVAPGNMPAVIAATAITAGTDDRASVNAARIVNQLPLIKVGYGDGAISIPGFGSAVHAGLIAIAKSSRRIAILSGPRGATASDLATLGLDLGSSTGAENAGLFGPYLQVSDGAGGIRTVSPEGYVAACRAKAHDTYGPWALPAGEGSVTPYILGVDVDFTRTDADTMSAGRANPIRIVQNRIRLYDWRSVSSNEVDYASLATADLLDRLVTECEARLEPYVFRTIDGRGHLLAEMQGVLVGVLEPVRAAGGLFERTDPISGDVLDPGYSVDLSRVQNPDVSLANNVVNAVVAVRPSPNASLINLTIVKVGLTAAV